MKPLVILRPEPGASATAEAARRLGLEPIVVPLFRIEPITWTAPDPSIFDGVLITSANAIRVGGTELRKLAPLPVYAVGEATARAVREAGFIVESVGTGGVDALLASLSPNLKLLHLCGSDRREPIAPAQNISAIPVYNSAELPVPDDFHYVKGAVVAVHSARSARRLAKLTGEFGLARKCTSIAAISAEAATAVGDGWMRVEASSEPDESALLALAARLCQNVDQ